MDAATRCQELQKTIAAFRCISAASNQPLLTMSQEFWHMLLLRKRDLDMIEKPWDHDRAAADANIAQTDAKNAKAN